MKSNTLFVAILPALIHGLVIQERAEGENVQTFTGSLGGTAPPVIKGTGNRPFSIDGDTFVNSGAALQRSCDRQKNACAQQVNSKKIQGSVADCDKQQKECVAATKGAQGAPANNNANGGDKKAGADGNGAGANAGNGANANAGNGANASSGNAANANSGNAADANSGKAADANAGGAKQGGAKQGGADGKGAATGAGAAADKKGADANQGKDNNSQGGDAQKQNGAGQNGQANTATRR
ncbi:hypothetical protein MCOR25_001565 [Pyricularia grisea]|uniref:Uncharacterized protein n=1 Tax=Pyricularia grisea TaxID=148305 RepID=A0A6P8BLK6_PYRGI|nr:uncharacterized protein PgNI_01014 [Pyricularia grisea]KAI6380629.1 hypothetical protein MCOR25_001565 [Pyricularia grisea]TLD17492.1 hypothetical protein PgNI_01014 [Pyricularia grisea]